MNLNDLPNREALARAFAQLGYRRGAEIGVYRGQYSEVLCKCIPGLSLTCVDTWSPSRNHVRVTECNRAFRAARRVLQPYGAQLLKMTSLEGAKQVPDKSLDFVYIDALHDFEHVSEDLNAWVPKVRPGGAVAGHDWTMPGVTAAVQCYAAQHPVTEIYTTKPCPEDWMPSWCWIKHA